LSLEQAVPCGLLVYELLSNSLKHGFPQRLQGEVRIELVPLAAPGWWRLAVADNGVGWAARPGTVPSTSMGMQLVSQLCLQIGGEMQIGSGPGARVSVEFEARHAASAP
jgi:two-component sensor histidine kinase